MTTNGEWLFSKPFDEQVAWMDEEHKDGTLDGDTAALNAKIAYMTMFGKLCDEATESDSRDKIEIEAFKLFSDWSTLSDDAAAFLTGCVAGFLDRQAAITEREVCAWIRGKDAEHDERIHRVAELQAQVDKLTADLNKEIYERERYRKKFGKCLDYADAIHALMDDEGMA